MPVASKNGPQMEDCETLMRAIEALHGGQVQLTVTPAGISASGGLAIVISHLSPTLADGSGFTDLLVTTRWPSAHHVGFFACIFEGLYQLDAKIFRAYEQKRLPGG